MLEHVQNRDVPFLRTHMIRQLLMRIYLALFVLGGLLVLQTAPALANVQPDSDQLFYTLRLATGPCADLDLESGDMAQSATPTVGLSPPFEVYTFGLEVEGRLANLLEQPAAVVIDVQTGGVLELFACGDVPATSNSGERVAALVAIELDTLVGTAVLTELDPNGIAVRAYLLLVSPEDQDSVPGLTPATEPENEPDDGEPEGGV
jgi:hypothetical protein